MKNTNTLLKKLSIVLGQLFLVVFALNAQNLSFCKTQPDTNAIGAINEINTENLINSKDAYFLKIYVHVVRLDGGFAGVSSEAVKSAINFLREDFKPHSIYFIWDCTIDYIDNTLVYYQDVCNLFYPLWIFDYSPHTDGIDIYFFDDDWQSCGRAEDIPSSAFYITGSFDGEPNIAFVSSHVVSHEMGHCLGLWHTFHGTAEGGFDNPCPELINGSNCNICGDYVCDTPPDPNMDFDVDYPDCQWNGMAIEPVSGQPYTPDELNIMSYSNPSCMQYFTSGQGNRMRQIIATTPVLQACLVQGDFASHTITANTNVVWTPANTPNIGDFLIMEDLVIESGATLVVKQGVTVHFGSQGRLLIKPNAKLILEGTLTGMGCDGFTWKGVEVWGSSPLESQYVINGTRAQGRVECLPGSLIEHARVGIQLYGPSYSQAGGQLSCDGAILKNCQIGVKFAPYQNFWPFATPEQGQPRNYFASFKETSFLANDTYLHNEPFHSFVHMTGVNGISFSGCSFTNACTMVADDIPDRGYGIFANDSGFNVVSLCTANPVPYPNPCTSYVNSSFSGLGYGIYSARIVTNRPYTVRQANFDKCFVSIRNKSVTGGTLLFNNFYLGQLPSTGLTGDQVGVIFETDVSGFTCEENDFIGGSGNAETTIGIICINTGIANKTIRRNKFESLTYGNLANEQNATQLPQDGIRGLYYDCNRNFDVDEKDFLVSNGRIRAKQGLEKPDPTNPGQVIYGAAGNRFSYTAVDFSNFGVPNEYLYNYLGQNQQPLTIEGSITLVPTSESNGCPVTYCEPPCRTKEEIALVKSDFYQQRDGYLSAKADYAVSPTDEKARQMSYHQRMMDEDSYMVVIHELYDTLGFNADTLRTWMMHLGSLEGDLWLASERLGTGNTQAALSLLNAAIGKYQLTGEAQTDIGNCQSILNLLNGKLFYELDAATLQSVEGYLNADGYAEGWAKSILTLYGGHFPAEYMKDGGRIEERSTKGGDLPRKVKQPEWMWVTPNPARDYVDFSISLPGDPKEVSIRIFDLNGRQVQVKPGLAPVGSFIWQTDGHQAGVYFYHLMADGKVLKSGKIILNK